MNNISNFFMINLSNNTILAWILAGATTCTLYFFFQFLKEKQTAALLEKPAEGITKWMIYPSLMALRETKSFLIAMVALWIGAQFLTFSLQTETTLRKIGLIALVIQSGLWASMFFDRWISLWGEQRLAAAPSAASSLSIMTLMLRMTLWGCILLMLLDIFGVNVTALLTGLGIGGVAVALAAQSILGDLFASMTIALDKPFVTGDFIALGDHMGSVEHVGLKNTRLRSLSGEQIILSNSDMLASRIRNYGRLYERRVAITLRVPYSTPREKLILIPTMIKRAIVSQTPVRFDRAHLANYGQYSIDFEYVYFVLSSDYNLYMNINQSIYLDIHAQLEEANIDFAYPTQTIVLERNPHTEQHRFKDIQDEQQTYTQYSSLAREQPKELHGHQGG